MTTTTTETGHSLAAAVRSRLVADEAVRLARLLVVLVAVEAALVVGYLVVADAGVLAARYVVYPFVWVNAVVLAVASVGVPDPSAGARRARTGLVALAASYFVVLCAAGGLASLGHHAGLGTLGVVPAVPGWGPLVTLSGGAIQLTLVPFKLVGYLGLATLAYVALVRASRGVLSGALGLVTCVGCTGPVLAGLLAGVGGSSAVVSAAVARSYDLSTAVFLATVLALWLAARR